MLNKQVNFRISTMKKLPDLAHEKLIYINGGYGGSVKTETHFQRECSILGCFGQSGIHRKKIETAISML